MSERSTSELRPAPSLKGSVVPDIFSDNRLNICVQGSLRA